MRHLRRSVGVLILVMTFVAVNHALVEAQSSSSNYKVTETFFGSGGELNACSSSYCSKQSIGEITAGLTEGTNFSARAGFNTTDIPLLEVSVVGGTFDLGVLTPTTTGSGSTTLAIRNYLSHGYVVRMYGDPLKQQAHTMTALTTPTTSQQGQEQFGMNLRDNTTPNVGADPQQIPSGSFSYGTYATDYDIIDSYKYVSGDIVAQSTKSSGETQYTLSFIANINSLTPAGQYQADLSAVVVSTY